ncbi:DUF4254 domain-containing protein [Uliginosibacterium sp. 31-12]|uniref:DUF4254 domain-containing protein n=1 Tax=Uliginosibacterium sp. 31-12 TaxID=3062781 RepID=UPI0026E48D22|nr:DUF4254 domain-containing protein [Uliginosibacterium sp. 31-12]MDO6388155.1 DUF4254 domain-containing protein [Uliginosibacterium sp. 31-12]
MTKLIDSAEIIAFHDACVANRSWAKSEPARFAEGLWQFLELNHRFNNLLWDEEDLARRKDVADSEIAANKRAIDGYNQKRNDAIERMDEVFLSALPPAVTGSRLNSETAGSMIDRISILGLKVFHMGEQTRRSDASAEHIATCEAKLARLREQRADLAACLEQLLADCAAGVAHYKVYRQFKMYNDPTLNPYLYGGKKS